VPLFDPDTGIVIDREALASVQVNASGPRRPRTQINPDGTKRIEILCDDTGRSAGWNDHHSSGRIDATATPEPVRINGAPNKE
jgi:hypothetical protein